MGSAVDVFWTLVAKADKKFSRLRDLPPYGGSRWDYYYDKTFQVYTKLWKIQQENRQALVDAGLRRWEIGEIASRIGQLYYNYYMRTSDATFLLESYIFYEAIVNRDYFKDLGKDAVLANKHLRFYVRFIVVCLLLNRREMATQLARQLRALIDEYQRNFQEKEGKEWKHVGQDISKFLKVDSACHNSRPLRYSVRLDPSPTTFPSLSRLGGHKQLSLKDAILVSYHQNEVKFSELTLDTFRFLQCLEWEPSGSHYRSRVTESNGATATSIRLDDIMDQSLPPNPRKYILHRPSMLQLLLVLATACEELPGDSILLLYFSALGMPTSTGTREVSVQVSRSMSSGCNSNPIISPDHDEGHLDASDMSPSSSPEGIPMTVGDSINQDLTSLAAGLWFGSSAGSGIGFLYPADLLPFTRKPLFIIIDSDRSGHFELIHGGERGEPAALLLSPSVWPQRGADYQVHRMGSFFTFFLTAPLLAFCQLVKVSATTLPQGTNDQLHKVLTSAMVDWGQLLSLTDLNLVWVRIMWDPFLRQLLLRFIFCRACLALHRDYGVKEEYLPHCLPPLPKEFLPMEAAIEGPVHKIASQIGVVDQFKFSPRVADLEKRLESQSFQEN